MPEWSNRNALAKAIYGRSCLTDYVYVQWVVSSKFIGIVTPHHFSNYIFGVNDFWLAPPWGHDQSTVRVLVGFDRGHVCGLGTTFTKYFLGR